MGILWRLLAPKPVKRARRSVRKVTHPVHTVTRAATPKSVKRLQRAAHPFDLAELKAEDAVVNALQGKRKRKRTPARKRAPAGSPAAGISTRPARAAPQPTFPHPQAQAQAPALPRTEAASQPLSDQRQEQIAEHYAQRQARIAERAAERQAKAASRAGVHQAKAAGRAAVHQTRAGARRQRKAARKKARGPWRWPEWSLVAGAVALVAWLVLVVSSHGTFTGAAGAATIPAVLIWLLAALVAGPAALWRSYRARRAAAVMLASAPQHQADSQAP